MDSNKKNRDKDSSRLLVLVVLVLLANTFMIALLYRYHNYALEQSAAQHEIARIAKEGEITSVKEEIRLLEGVPTWEETALASFFHQQ